MNEAIKDMLAYIVIWLKIAFVILIPFILAFLIGWVIVKIISIFGGKE